MPEGHVFRADEKMLDSVLDLGTLIDFSQAMLTPADDFKSAMGMPRPEEGAPRQDWIDFYIRVQQAKRLCEEAFKNAKRPPEMRGR